MIIDIIPGTFGGPMRNGDLVGVCNVVEYLRQMKNDNNIKFNLKPGSVNSAQYCVDFHHFLLENTDYLTTQPGEKTLSWRNVNLWDFRDICGDLVKIPNNRQQKKKIVVFPLFDASYNTYRNWPKELFDKILKEYEIEQYKDYEKIICSKDNVEVDGWKNSTDFMANVYHIMDAEIFIGGDTGTSHFAGALESGPKQLIYYYSSRGLLHTTPFYALGGKGQIRTYWLDFENTQWV